MSKLTSTSRIKTATEEINKQLITDISKRKVNFTLTSENRDSLKKASGNDFLVKAIVENLLERTKEKIILLQKYFTHCEDDIPLQAKRAVEIAKEYIRKFGNDEEDKESIEFFKKVIPDLEKFIAAIERKGRR